MTQALLCSAGPCVSGDRTFTFQRSTRGVRIASVTGAQGHAASVTGTLNSRHQLTTLVPYENPGGFSVWAESRAPSISLTKPSAVFRIARFCALLAARHHRPQPSPIRGQGPAVFDPGLPPGPVHQRYGRFDRSPRCQRDRALHPPNISTFRLGTVLRAKRSLESASGV